MTLVTLVVFFSGMGSKKVTVTGWSWDITNETGVNAPIFVDDSDKAAFDAFIADIRTQGMGVTVEDSNEPGVSVATARAMMSMCEVVEE